MADDRRVEVREDWLSVADVAAELDMHPATVRKWANEGVLRGQRAGKKKWRFSRQALDEFIRAHSRALGDTRPRYTDELDPGAVNTREDVLL